MHISTLLALLLPIVTLAVFVLLKTRGVKAQINSQIKNLREIQVRVNKSIEVFQESLAILKREREVLLKNNEVLIKLGANVLENTSILRRNVIEYTGVITDLLGQLKTVEQDTSDIVRGFSIQSKLHDFVPEWNKTLYTVLDNLKQFDDHYISYTEKLLEYGDPHRFTPFIVSSTEEYPVSIEEFNIMADDLYSYSKTNNSLLDKLDKDLSWLTKEFSTLEANLLSH